MTRKCPECGRTMWEIRDEYEALCDHCMIVVQMNRAAFNDLKKYARSFEGTEDEFAVKYIVPEMARRAYRAAKRG